MSGGGSPQRRGAPREPERPLRVGVIVPCRNEARVVARRIANLSHLEWPAGEHRVRIVDDGSEDGTADVAERALGAASLPSHVGARVIPNTGQGGKASAIGCALDDLGESVDVVLLTDADVVFSRGTLAALVGAFEGDDSLGMACGEQTFVEELPGDGRDAGAAAIDRGGRYDHWTASVRRFESRGGRLFSVHGQCLAWRRSLELRPTPGIAADDLELMLQARAAGKGVRLVPGARFFEVKAAAGETREGQALRRARAYFQVFRQAPVARARALGHGPWNTLQWLAYRHLPGAAPWLALACMVALTFCAHIFLGATGVALLLVAFLVASVVPAVRDLGRLLWTIERARRSSRELNDRWEMPRT